MKPARLLLIAVVLGAFGLGAAPASSALAAGPGTPAACVVHSLPAFIAQGEFTTTGTVADVVEVECDPETYGTKAKMRITDDQLYLRCERSVTWYVPNTPGEGFFKETGSGVSVELDPDGNATVALLAGPNCTPGETLVGAHMEGPPFETFTTPFSILPPRSTPQAAFTTPSSQVVDAFSSAFATIIQLEFPAVNGEQTVRVGSEELFHRCRMAPHLRWIAMNGAELAGASEVTGIPLDNDGNAFVIVIGDASCAVGTSMIEADLESAPFTTLITDFTIEPPQPTAEPAFTIEKLQEIEGSGTGLTSAPLKGTLGQTVDYEIFVKNTTRVPEKLSGFTDPNCDPGTLVGGIGNAALEPGETTTFTCSHRLSALGPYINEASVTANTVGGSPLTLTSNQVLVEAVTSGFAIEKSQRIAGSGTGYTTSTVTGSTGQTVEYQIKVTNTGTTSLSLSGFADQYCDSGTLSGGPGAAALAPKETTVYTCSHVLTGGPVVNVATVTGTPPGEAPLTKTSNAVTAEVAAAPSHVEGPPPPGPREEAHNGSLPVCEAQPILRLRGASGPKQAAFTARVTSGGLKQVSLYIDGHRIKTWRPKAQNTSRLSLRINPLRLAFGGHRLSAKTKPNNKVCRAVTASQSFIRVHPAKPLPPAG